MIRRLGMLMVSMLVFCQIGVCAIATQEGSPPLDDTDWPKMIEALKAELWRHPGQKDLSQQLAYAYNNYAVLLGQRGEWEEAVSNMEEALRLENNPDMRKSLSYLYLNQASSFYQDPSAARSSRQQTEKAKRLIQKALDINPDFAEAYQALGNIEYGSQRLKEAQKAWAKAWSLNPDLPNLAQSMQRLAKELPVEAEFDKLTQMYFDLRYEDQVQRTVGFNIQDTLMEARRQVGGDFRLWPKYTTVVLIYSAENFRQVRQDSPLWAGGMYDGKIRIPLPGLQYNEQEVKTILFHEYTHVLVYDLAGPKCPTWLNEGLAEYGGAKAGKRPLDLLSAALKDNQLIPWDALDAQLTSEASTLQAGLAYQQSHSIVAYLADRYGFWRMRNVLAEIKTGVPAWQAIEKEFKTKRPRMERQWLEWLPEFLR